MVNLAGSYELKSHGVFEPNGSFVATSPWLKGLLIYGDKGELAVMIQFSEKNEKPKDMLSYVGRYEIKSENEVIHHIHLCSDFGRNSKGEPRSYKLDGNRLVLGADLGGGRRFEAQWVRQ